MGPNLSLVGWVDLLRNPSTAFQRGATLMGSLPLNPSYTPPARAALIARHTFSGVTGMSMWRMP